MDVVADDLPGLAPLDPLPPETTCETRRELFARLAHIDGWGPRAWKEVLGAWQLSTAALVIEPVEVAGDTADTLSAILVLARHGLGGEAADADATADWVLRLAWRELLPGLDVSATTYRPTAAVRPSNACWLSGPSLYLRLVVRPPMAGMCCDGRRFARFIRALEGFAGGLLRSRARPALRALRRAVRVQRQLRAQLPGRGLVAFLGDGARLARGADGAAATHCRPLRAPRALRVTIPIPPFGRVTGLAIPQGITALAGAPYHGKSTLLAALAAGREDHPPGDGRELVVADDSALAVQAEDGRRIKAQDLSSFFSVLPATPRGHFTTERASGATSMAASLLQGCAAGCRLLLIDEDTAASNFLSIDAPMRRLLGAAVHGTVSLLETLPALARLGISTVLVAGSSSASLAVADRVLVLERFEPHDRTQRAHALAGRSRRPRAGARLRGRPQRVFGDDPDCLLGPRHFLSVDASECERPLIQGVALDLRRSGWLLDAELTRGACSAAAWCCRLAERGLPLSELAGRYRRFIAQRGACGLDPFHTQLLTVPPWQLVVSILERLPRPWLESGAKTRGS